MNNNNIPEFAIGEVSSGSENKLVIIDMLSGIAYSVPSYLERYELRPGQIVYFTTDQGSVSDVRVLAVENSAKARLYDIAASSQLTPCFPTPVLQETEEILQETGLDDPTLENLESLPFCTIDGKDTKDLDQALFVEQIASGFKIYYALADASYYIKPDMAIFEEALQRGASYYLPGLMIPMLPRELCIGMISLNENELRRAMIFEMTLDDGGRLLSSSVIRGKINSRAKLSFQEVEAFFSGGTDSVRGDMELTNSLRALEKVGRLRMSLAAEKGVVRYHRSEVEIKLKHDGLIFSLLDNVRNNIELYNEQISLLCNTVGAEMLTGSGFSIETYLQPIYKVHPSPSQDKLNAFKATLDLLIQHHDLDPERWRWHDDRGESLAEYLKSLPKEGKFAGITKAIHRQAIMVNARSMFSEHPEQHYGVGADVYARFSSPMREIVGIFLHKELMEKKYGTTTGANLENKDEILRERIIKAANRSAQIQKQLTNAANMEVLNQFFEQDLSISRDDRPARVGTIIGFGRDKIYVLLRDIEIEIKIYAWMLENLWHKQVKIDLENLVLYSSRDQQALFFLGDDVKVSVVDRDIKKQRWIFDICPNV